MPGVEELTRTQQPGGKSACALLTHFLVPEAKHRKFNGFTHARWASRTIFGPSASFAKVLSVSLPHGDVQSRGQCRFCWYPTRPEALCDYRSFDCEDFSHHTVGKIFELEPARIYRIPIPPQLDLPISYNIAPSQDVLVIRFNPKRAQRSLDALRWGLIPYWAKDP